MSLPSMMRSVGAVPPDRFAKVRMKSMVPTTASLTWPLGIRAGHCMTQGSRMPPSKVVPLPSRNGPAEPP